MTDGGVIDLFSMMMGGVTGQADSVDPYAPISYPINLPNVMGVREIAWYADQVRKVSESPFTLQRQVYRHSGERWRVAIVLPPMTRAEAAEWESFLLLLSGGYGQVWFGDVLQSTPRGKAWGAPQVDGDGQSGRVLVTKGWNPNIEGVLLAGDRFQLGNYLYSVLRSVNSTGAGIATLDIFPALRSSPTDGQTIITHNPKGLFRLSSNSSGLYGVNARKTYSLPTIELVEAL